MSSDSTSPIATFLLQIADLKAGNAVQNLLKDALEILRMSEAATVTKLLILI